MAVVEVYSSAFCPFCHRAKRLLAQKGVNFVEVDVLQDPERRTEMAARAGGYTSVPQIFIDGVHVGGYDELYALERAGRLTALLEGCRA